MKKKYALHEQNYIPGRLNYFFAKKAMMVFTSFKETEKYFKTNKNKIIHTGKPVRKKIFDAEKRNRSSLYKKLGLKSRFELVNFFLEHAKK